MGLSGVIYAIIVVAWAAYLVPQALRRHDEALKTRSIQRFSSAMRVLSRRGVATGRVSGKAGRGRLVVTPPRSDDRLLPPSLGPKGAVTGIVPAARRPSKAALRAGAARRRRGLALLLVTTVLVAAASALGFVPLWSNALPSAAVLGFLAVARRQVRRTSDAYWRQAAEPARQASNVVRRDATRVDASHGEPKAGSAKTAAAPEVTVGGDPDEQPTITLQVKDIRRAVVEQHVVAVSVPTSDGGSLWDPVPVTLPTYVGKPAVTRTIRTIELGEQGTWSSGHSEAASTAATGAAGAAGIDEGPPADVDGGAEGSTIEGTVAEPRRAANG